MQDPNQQVEKVTVKDLPLSVSNEEVKSFLASKGIELTTDVRYSKERDDDGKLTAFLNGDRYVYAKSPITPPLTIRSSIADLSCRVYHPSQSNNCKVCGAAGHKTKDSACPAYISPQDNVLTFVSYQNPLSNMWMGEEIEYDGRRYKSVEHCYQATKALHADMFDLHDEIMAARHAGVAKALSHRIPDSPTWQAKRVDIMKDLLEEKASVDSQFCDALRESDDKTLAHTVADSFWGTGLSPFLTTVTKKQYWGKNLMGNLLMDLRTELTGVKEGENSSKTHDDPLPQATAPEVPINVQTRGRNPLRGQNGRHSSPSPAHSHSRRPRSQRPPIGRSKSTAHSHTTPITNIEAYLKRKSSGTPPDSNQHKLHKAGSVENSEGPG